MRFAPEFSRLAGVKVDGAAPTGPARTARAEGMDEARRCRKPDEVVKDEKDPGR